MALAAPEHSEPSVAVHSPSVALRISGVGHQAAGFGVLLREAWGYSAVRDGDDWVVLGEDPCFRAPPREVLKLHGPLRLAGAKQHKLAGKLLSWIPGQLDEFIAQLSHLVTFDSDEDSTLHRVYICRTRLATAPRDFVRDIIRDELLPIMDKMGATEVLGITADVKYQQMIYTCSKFGLLAKDHDFESMERLVFQQKAFGGILPHGLDLLTYVNALTRLAPIAFTLPVGHGDCTWHFVGPKGFLFRPSVFCQGLFQQFIDHASPISEDVDILPVAFSPALNQSASYLKFVIDSLNTLMSFLNDLRNFADPPDNLINFSRQVQAFAALDLLLADLASLNYATAGYHRISCSMNALDKLANMIKYVGQTGGKEAAIFKSLLSMRQCEICCDIYQRRVKAHNSKIIETIVQITKEAYKAMHAHYRAMDPNLSEGRIVDLLYSQRNLRHGTFLKGEQFVKMFQDSEGTVANEIVSIVYMLTLALALEPKKFLRLDPSTLSQS